MKIVLKDTAQAISVAKRMLFLAYNASAPASGMGMFQEARLGGKPADEETVWNCAYNAEDYMGLKHEPPNVVHADYVFGRMMKWSCKWEKNVLSIRDDNYHWEYQSFSGSYPTSKDLVVAALESLGLKDVATNVKEYVG